MSWDELSRQVGVAASTVRRFGGARDAEADGVLAVVRWLGVPPEDFVTSDVPGDRLPSAGPGFVRVDMELVARADPGRRGRTRITIQSLVEIAHGSGRSVASLTRISDA